MRAEIGGGVKIIIALDWIDVGHPLDSANAFDPTPDFFAKDSDHKGREPLSVRRVD
jgi:hypothetical protein